MSTITKTRRAAGPGRRAARTPLATTAAAAARRVAPAIAEHE